MYKSLTFLKLSQTMGITQKTVHSSVALMLQARRMSFMTGTSLCLRFVWLFVNFSSNYFSTDRGWNQTYSLTPFFFTPPGGNGHPTEGFLSAQPLGHLHQHHTGSEGAWGGGKQSDLKQKGSQGQCALCLIFFNSVFHSETWCSISLPPRC